MNESTLKNKIRSLQGMRAILFLGVLSFHCGIGSQGAWCVSVFFVLSGFVYSYHYLLNNVNLKTNFKSRVEFAFSKIMKLYPMHCVMLIAKIFLMIIKGAGISYIISVYETLIPNVLLIQSWYPDSRYYFSHNGATWYLSTTLFLYFMFPIILERLRKFGSKKVLCCLGSVIVIQLSVALYLMYTPHPLHIGNNFRKWVTYICPIYRLGDFIIGCCLGYFYIYRKETKGNPVWGTVKECGAFMIGIIQIFIYTLLQSDAKWESVRYSILFIPSSMLIVYFLAENNGGVSWLLSRKWIVKLGELSAGMYITHQVIIGYINAIGVEEKYVVCILAYLVCLVCTNLFLKSDRIIEYFLGKNLMIR